MIIQSNLVKGEFQELAANKRQEVQILEGYYLLKIDPDFKINCFLTLQEYLHSIFN